MTTRVLVLVLASALLCGCEGGRELAEDITSLDARAEKQPVAVDAPTVPVAELTELATIPAGSYRPMFPGKDEPALVSVASFQLEEHAVTTAQFLEFVRAEPRWRKSRVPALFSGETYLESWTGDLEPPAGAEQYPVTEISWFAARAYARWAGRRLPVLAEWEYVAAAGADRASGREDPAFNQRILDWYSRPGSEGTGVIRSTFQNFYGIHDMHGLIWEWVEDFNNALVTGESRGDSELERSLFCGSGSIGSADPRDYAAFMRFAFRSSLEASWSTTSLGFRCAMDLPGEK